MGGKAEGKRRKGEDKMEGRLRGGGEEAEKRRRRGGEEAEGNLSVNVYGLFLVF